MADEVLIGEPSTNRRPLPFRAGLGPGLLGALTMFVMLGIVSIATGGGFWDPMQIVAAPFVGRGAPVARPAWMTIGTLVHFTLGALFGGVYARVVGQTRRRRQLGLGAGYSMLLWLVAQFLVLPLVVPSEAARLGLVWSFFMGHLGYGLMLGASVPTTDDIDVYVH